MGNIKLNSGQKKVFEKLKHFITKDDHDIFILNGYAGTGKTFLMQYLGDYLDKNKMPFNLLASTGRAAAILRGKTKFSARTVHSYLYKFDKVSGVNDSHNEQSPIDSYGQMKLQFTFTVPVDQSEKRILIFDEASMISSQDQGETSHAVFGSGNLMEDIFKVTRNCKLIFVGDPAQLPPVHQLTSPALDKDWLENKGRKVTQATLTKIERTESNNDILPTAEQIRFLLQKDNLPKWPKIPFNGRTNISVIPNENDLIYLYLENYRKKGPRKTILITNSNRLVWQCNSFIRQELYNQVQAELKIGDILLVTQNNYLVPLANGDFVKVIKIGHTKHRANLKFTNVRIRSLITNKDYDILLAMDVLESYFTNFSADQNQMLMIDFIRRMAISKVQVNTSPFNDALRKDPYLNCLKATYGYAITCHKAQGGEWDDVFVLGQKAMHPAPKHIQYVRWWYTALTRTKHRFYTNSGYWIS